MITIIIVVSLHLIPVDSKAKKSPQTCSTRKTHNIPLPPDRPYSLPLFEVSNFGNNGYQLVLDSIHRPYLLLLLKQHPKFFSELSLSNVQQQYIYNSEGLITNNLKFKDDPASNNINSDLHHSICPISGNINGI